MLDWAKIMFINAFDHACQAAVEHGNKDNPYAKLTEKALAKVVVDAMAASATKNGHLGKAVVALIRK